MKRSKINSEIRHMEELIQEHGFEIPPFCKWTPEEWNNKGSEYDEIRDNMLGWDITDYGLGKFDEIGFSLITIRNGNLKMDKYTKTYAEKLLVVKEGQMAPMHFHWNKMEDIINRGGGNVLITVYNSTEDGKFADTDVTVNCDGHEYTVPAGTQIKLTPGESITIYPYMYHDFHVEEGSGDVLLGEVSMCNDDENDNRFYEPIGRFPEIEEDEKLLCTEYPKAKQKLVVTEKEFVEENDLGYARFLAEKVCTLANVFEMGSYNECVPMLNIVTAEKNVKGTFQLAKQLLEGFRNEEDFDYMREYEPWKKLLAEKDSNFGVF